MSDKTVYVRLGLQGAEDIQAALNKLGQAGEAAFARIRAASERAAPGSGTKLDAGLAKLKAAYDGIGKANAQFGKTIDFAAQSFTKFNSALATTSLRLGAAKLAFDTVAGGIFLLGKNAIDTVDELDRQSQALGLTIESYTGLVAAAEASSVEQEQLAGALQRVNVYFENQADAVDKATTKLNNEIDAIRANTKESEDQYDKIAKATKKAANAASEERDALDKLGLSYEELKDKTPEERLFALADAFKAAGSTAERNAAGVELFGKGAYKLIGFLAQGSTEIRRQIEEYKRFGFSIDESQKKIALLGDEALDKLSLALRGARLQLGLLFAPAVTEGANAFAEFIADNLDGLKAWGREAAGYIEQFVRDAINALKGLDSQVSNKWILDLRNAIQSIPPLVQGAISVVTVAFNTFGSVITPVADLLNAVFGTEFTGNSLAAAILIGKLSGAFTLFGSAVRLLVLVPLNTLVGVFRYLFTAIPYIAQGLTGIASTLAVAGPALVAFVAANPVLAVIIGTVAALAAGVLYLSTQQTELERATSEATIGMDDYDAAVRRAADGTKESTLALLEQQEALLNQRRLAIIDARERVDQAQAYYTQAQAAAENMRSMGFETAASNQLLFARDELKAATEVLAQREQNLADAQRKVSDAKARLAADAKSLAQELPKVGDAAGKAADGFIKIKIHMGAAGEKIQEVPRELDQAARKTAEAKKKIDDALKVQSPENDQLLASIQQRAETFVSQMEDIVRRYQNIGDGLALAMGNAFNSLPDAAAAAANRTASIFENLFSQIKSAIARLRAELNSLKSAASSTSSSAPKGTERFATGGYVYGSGGPTQDNIPAWLSSGEYVIRAAAVKRMPLSFLRAINSGRYDFSDLMRRFLNMRFADGGLVGLPSISMPSLAGAGMPAAGPTSSLTLVLGGESFEGLTGPADTIARLERAAKVRKVRATGRLNPYV